MSEDWIERIGWQDTLEELRLELIDVVEAAQHDDHVALERALDALRARVERT